MSIISPRTSPPDYAVTINFRTDEDDPDDDEHRQWACEKIEAAFVRLAAELWDGGGDLLVAVEGAFEVDVARVGED